MAWAWEVNSEIWAWAQSTHQVYFSEITTYTPNYYPHPSSLSEVKNSLIFLFSLFYIYYYFTLLAIFEN